MSEENPNPSVEFDNPEHQTAYGQIDTLFQNLDCVREYMRYDTGKNGPIHVRVVNRDTRDLLFYFNIDEEVISISIGDLAHIEVNTREDGAGLHGFTRYLSFIPDAKDYKKSVIGDLTNHIYRCGSCGEISPELVVGYDHCGTFRALGIEDDIDGKTNLLRVDEIDNIGALCKEAEERLSKLKRLSVFKYLLEDEFDVNDFMIRLDGAINRKEDGINSGLNNIN